MVDKGKVDEIFELVWSIISDAFKKSNESCSTIPSSTSLKDYCIERISPSDLSEGDKELVFQLAETWGTFIGDPLEKQSLKYFWMEECLDGGIYNVVWDSTHIVVNDHQIISSWQATMAKSSLVSLRRLSKMPRSTCQPKSLP